MREIQWYCMESFTMLAEVQAALSDSLGGYTVRCASLYLILVVYINELHSPRKNVSSCSAICQWNFHSVVVETRPYLSETPCSK